MRRLRMSACFLAVACASCATPEKPPRPLGILIVTLDTTRADYLSAYGAGRAFTPHLDRLAAEGVVFEQASTVSPLTLPAHCSLFTGLLPPRHGVRDNAGGRLAADHVTLATTLRARGFATAAFVSSVVVGAGRGLDAGFAVYSDGLATGRPGERGLQRRADRVVDDAADWLEARGETPFFLWVHLYDPHAPYDPPEPFRTAYRDDLYAGEIAFADEQLGRLLDVLERRALLNRTAVFVAGDHGESLDDHRESGHGFFIYESVIRVPLIARVPGVSAQRVTQVVRLTDVMPTILQLIDAPSARTDGVSLVATMTGVRSPNDLEAYAESLSPARFGWSPLRSLRVGRYKLIDAPRPELYDLSVDPGERQDIHARNPAVAARLSRQLAALTREHPSWRDAGQTFKPAPETLAQLAALGYVAGASAAPIDRDQPLPDPKDRIDEYNRLVQRQREMRLPR